MNYYILILEEKVKSFSLVGYGEKCAVSLMHKGNANPLDNLVAGDKVIGYVAGAANTFSYLFDVGFDQNNQKLYFEKIFETRMGAQLTSASTELQAVINASEQTESFINITEEQYRQIISLMVNMVGSLGNEEIENSEDHEGAKKSPQSDDELPKKTCLEIVRPVRTQVLHSLNSIIYGAPGTGKTYLTPEYALAIIDNRQVDDTYKNEVERAKVIKKYNKFVKKGQIVFTTFHQSYGYEEFMQGLRPDTNTDTMKFKTCDGVFKKIADRALWDLKNNYVIIIDEINRANISKVFGELITLLEEDKRWGEKSQICATLQSGDVFAIPNNLYVVGTMNSADKSISLIDAALRRRFEFIEMKPNKELVKDSLLKKVLENLNKKLVEELGSTDLLIGHAYFMGKTKEDLPDIMNRRIIPLLYEYFYDDRKKVASVLKDIIDTIDGTGTRIVDDKIGRLRIDKVEIANDSELL